ncbi:hypothetical protein SEA_STRAWBERRYJAMM_31 [Microbacterium phage StrawberryJamm]|nr:hypothetical protein SEA_STRAWBERRYJAMM_31 [Microbacterium phage StrawberryJamm]
MPYNTPLPAENTDPWYQALVVVFIGGLRTFVNTLETTVGLKSDKTYVDGQLLLKADAASTAAALAGKIDTSTRGVNNGVATLGPDGKLLDAQLPALAVTEFLETSSSQAAMLAKTGQRGDWTIRTDLGTVWLITGTTPTQLSSWTEMGYPTAPITTVNGKTGVVVLSAVDVGALSTTDFDAYAAASLASFEALETVVATKAAAADLTALQGTVTTLQGTVSAVAGDANNAFTTATSAAAAAGAAQTTATNAIPKASIVDALNEVGTVQAVFIPFGGTVPAGTPPYTLVIEATA